jgi:hypothetical protein
MAAEKVREIPLSLKCILIGALIVGGGFYAYKKKLIRLPKGLT